MYYPKISTVFVDYIAAPQALRDAGLWGFWAADMFDPSTRGNNFITALHKLDHDREQVRACRTPSLAASIRTGCVFCPSSSFGGVFCEPDCAKGVIKPNSHETTCSLRDEEEAQVANRSIRILASFCRFLHRHVRLFAPHSQQDNFLCIHGQRQAGALVGVG